MPYQTGTRRRIAVWRAVANEHVIVLQIKPGTRFRHGVVLNELIPDEDATHSIAADFASSVQEWRN